VYKFEKLEIYRLAIEYLDLIYTIADKLPKSEEYNLRSQIIRAATSIFPDLTPTPSLVGKGARGMGWFTVLHTRCLSKFKRCENRLCEINRRYPK
jgi:hypothetical protein